MPPTPELPEQLRHWQPALHYRLIDEGRYSGAELERLEGTEQTELRRAFKTWFERVLLPHRLPGQRIGQVNDLTEVEGRQRF